VSKAPWQFHAEDSSRIHRFVLLCVCGEYERRTDVTEPRGDERREFVEDLERRTAFVRDLLDEIDRRRQEAEQQGFNFVAPTAEQLKKKFTSAESPRIYYQSWTSGTPPGGTMPYGIGIANPDPFLWINLFVHVFVGPLNVAPDVGDEVHAIDPRFPRLTMPAAFGLALDPGAFQSLNFSLTVPAGVDRSNYPGLAILYQASWFDFGRHLDRGSFVFEVT
jgi:hypothetical protein